MQASAPTTAASRDRAQRPRRSTQAPRARSPRSQRQQPLPSTKVGGISEAAPPPAPRRSSAPLSASISVARKLVHASTLAPIDGGRTPARVLAPRPVTGEATGFDRRGRAEKRQEPETPPHRGDPATRARANIRSHAASQPEPLT